MKIAVRIFNELREFECRGVVAALSLIVLILYSGLTIAWTPYTRLYPTNSNSCSTISPVALEPALWMDANIPRTVSYGQVFNLIIMVGNSGSVVADDVHILYKDSPPGYCRVQDVDQPYKALDQDSADVSLGNLVSNESKEINFIFQAPTQTQVAGLWSPYFRFEFTVSHDKNLLASSGTVELLIRHGQLLLTKKGFSSVPAPSIPIQSQSAQYNDNAVQSPDSYSATQKHPPLSSYFTPMNPGTPETFWQGGSS